MSAQLETQIRRKEKEIASLNEEQDLQQHEKNHATEQYKERNENFERLRERLHQANQEIEENDKEIAALRSELSVMSEDAQAASVDGTVLDNSDAQSLLEGLSAKDCINELISEMSLVILLIAPVVRSILSRQWLAAATTPFASKPRIDIKSCA